MKIALVLFPVALLAGCGEPTSQGRNADVQLGNVGKGNCTRIPTLEELKAQGYAACSSTPSKE